jgi:hypothetical protein
MDFLVLNTKSQGTGVQTEHLLKKTVVLEEQYTIILKKIVVHVEKVYLF